MMTGIVDYLDERSIPEPNSGCLLWTDSVDTDGRGRAYVDGREQLAHRVAWKAARGPIPDGLKVCHTCDIPSCINPNHLFLGTQLDNMRDKMAKGRHVSHAGERHGRAKLTAEQVETVRVSTDAQRTLALRYGVSKSLISMIRSGQRWKKRDDEVNPIFLRLEGRHE
jgi:hypothetical protein